ncbi:hypothetical protein O185_03815 [Photorhabdus temperata J3]|uniref:Uncharacterized protein n=1 Tax=Photorhabdus temperata J3 TaxID=1389415 RepID=U7R588_PHOTE|nr:hypothetical protein O185_03815 [Photorhabdus temperata J3]
MRNEMSFLNQREPPSGIFLGWTETVYEEWVRKDKMQK